MTTTPPLLRSLLPAVGVLLSALGILGLVRGERDGWGGFIYSPQRVVEWVEPGSAAADAGLQPGDSILTVDGRPAADLPMQSRWASTRPGQAHRLEFVREGRPLTVEVTYRPRGANPFAQGALVVLLAFLWGGLWARRSTDTAAARALGRAGLAAGVALAATPSVGGLWNGILSHVQVAALVLVVLFVLQLVVLLPTPKSVGASRAAAAAALTPWVLLVAFEVVELLVHPRLYRSTGNVAGLVILAYLALAVAALVHSLATTPRGTVWRSGLGWALLGMLLAITAIVVPMVGTAMRLPGAAWAELLLVALPLALALGVRQQARAAP
jgi:membrane-associated protease RseP (regulator of RpoE activity)